MRGLPTGEQVFGNISFRVIDPALSKRRAAIGLSYAPGFPHSATIPVGDYAPAVYLLHSSSDNIPSAFAGAVTFRYSGGREITRNIVKFRDVTNWWFSSLSNERAGVAWAGPNPVSTRVGVCWAAIDNPEPEKQIESLTFHAPLEGGIYAVLGISLSDRPHYVKPKVESFGGPDNWAAANAMAALVEGLAGIRNDGTAFDRVTLSPRWPSAGVDSVDVSIRLAASGGYVAYQYRFDRLHKRIRLTLTGSGQSVEAHILLPESLTGVVSVTVNGTPADYRVTTAEQSRYVDLALSLPAVRQVILQLK
jgi:hypothetical protein